MSANSKFHPSNFRITSKLSPALSNLPDLSRFNNPVSARADLVRGVRYGRIAAARAARGSNWDFEDETDALDLAIESVPLSESMSFAFLRGFAAEFRQTYQRRCGAA